MGALIGWFASANRALALALVCSAGCAVVPGNGNSPPTRVLPQEQDKNSDLRALLEDRVATREQILLALGEPDFVEGYGSYLLYTSCEVQGAVYTMFLPLPGSFPYGNQRLLMLAFDARGVLFRHQVRNSGLPGRYERDRHVIESFEAWIRE